MEMEKWDDSRINEKKEILAFELTALVHGTEEAEKAKQVSRSLFSGEGDDANMPTTELASADVSDEGMGIIDLMTACSLCASRGEARRLIEQGGVSVDGEKVASINVVISKEKLIEGVKIKKGKKVFHRAIIK